MHKEATCHVMSAKGQDLLFQPGTIIRIQESTGGLATRWLHLYGVAIDMTNHFMWIYSTNIWVRLIPDGSSHSAHLSSSTANNSFHITPWNLKIQDK
jgi:hypothetical protein